MNACQGYGCLARSLERQDAREAQEEQAEGWRGTGGGPAMAVPVIAAVAVPAVALFAGTPLDIIRAGFAPSRRRATP